MPSRRALKVGIKLVLTAVALVVVLRWVGADNVRQLLRSVSVVDWTISLALFCTIHAVASLKWRLFIGLCGGRLSVGATLRCYAAGLFANLCLPSMIGGDVMRAGLAAKANKRKEAVVLGSLVDRFSDFVGLALIAVWGLLLAISGSTGSQGSIDTGKNTLVAFFVSAAALVVGVVILTRLRPKPSWPPRVRFAMLRGALAVRKLRRRGLTAALGLCASAALQVALLLVHRRLAVTMGMPASLPAWLFVWPLAKIAAMLPLSLGGLGVREAAFASLGAGMGFPKDLAVACSLAWQCVLISGGLVGGAIWGLYREPSRRAQAEVATP